jgi:hypothetical protein
MTVKLGNLDISQPKGHNGCYSYHTISLLEMDIS